MTPYTFDVRNFVPREVYLKYGEKSKWFVSDNIVRLHAFCHNFFDDYVRKTEKEEVESVTIVVNNWASGGDFNNRCLRTVEYINGQVADAKKNNRPQPATLSQHVGGSSNAMDFNVLVKFKSGKTKYLDSNVVRKIIQDHSTEFMGAGLTTLEHEHFAPTWCHADCRFTGMSEILIVKP